MKKIIILILFTSCMKERTCTCDYESKVTYPGSVVTYTAINGTYTTQTQPTVVATSYEQSTKYYKVTKRYADQECSNKLETGKNYEVSYTNCVVD